MKTINLVSKTSLELCPKPPFNFQKTVWKQSHFPLPIEKLNGKNYWQFFNFDNKNYGIKMEDKGNINKPKIKLTIYSVKKISKTELESIIKEINWRFELDKDISGFEKFWNKDNLLAPLKKEYQGTRGKCGYSLYEALMVYILLQNTVVRRTIQMGENLLNKYGRIIEFGGQRLYTFWFPKQLVKVSEKELRNLKVGYRAKIFKRISEDFASGKVDEFKLRKLPKEELKQKLLKIYGVGNQSVWYLLKENFHFYDAFDYISPWEAKIYSRLFFNKDNVSPEKILKEAKRRWGNWRMYACHIIFDSIFWKHKGDKIEWLEKKIRK